MTLNSLKKKHLKLPGKQLRKKAYGVTRAQRMEGIKSLSVGIIKIPAKKKEKETVILPLCVWLLNHSRFPIGFKTNFGL